MLLTLGLILFVCLVIVHEYGHLRAARKGGIVVEEFGVGFPPKVLGKKLKSGMLLTFNLLPLGGFVRLKGEHDADKEPGSYGAASLKTKVKVLLAGVFMNLAVAIGILTLLALIGTPQLFDNQFTYKSDEKIARHDILVGYVEPGSPAEKAGLKLNDKLIATGGTTCGSESGLCKNVDSSTYLVSETEAYQGLPLNIKYERDGKAAIAKVQLRTREEVERSKKTETPKGYLGIGPTEYTVKRYTWSAPIVAVGETAQFTYLTLRGIGTAIGSVFSGNGGEAAKQVSGPVGIFVLIKDGSLLGYQFILMIIAIISLTLAIMNALPIPALDGGKLFITLLYRALKKPLDENTESIIHGLGFVFLMLLFVVITVVDIKKYF